MWYCTRKSGVPEKYVRVVKNILDVLRTVRHRRSRWGRLVNIFDEFTDWNLGP